MRTALARLLGAVAVAAWPAAHGAAAHGDAARVAAPKVVEFFTAQGCSPCTKVGERLAELASRPDVVVITWPVDYWDYLGWKDTFAQPEFDERQRAYDRRFGLRDVYTPQVIVDGAIQGSGAQPGRLEALMREADRLRRDPPQMLCQATDRAQVGSGPRPRRGADVWLVRFDPKDRAVDVKSGDNRGKTIVQTDVVRQLDRLGNWRGWPRAYALPPPSEEGLASLVLLQEARGGPILGACLDRPKSAPPKVAPPKPAS